MNHHWPTHMSEYQKFIAVSKYSRWRYDLNRREYWNDTVDRYINHMRLHVGKVVDWDIVRDRIFNLEVFPSMRMLASAGAALSAENAAGYNCSYLELDSPKAFSELIYLLMCGCGVGFSVESRVINRLPVIPRELSETDKIVHIVGDTRKGWAKAIYDLMDHAFKGRLIKFDYSRIRPEGTPLKTFGGRASGPGPLRNSIEKIKEILLLARGRRLKPIEVHDIACYIASCVIAGGVRRSAMISLSDVEDRDMAHAKSGQWWVDNPQRAFANNSSVFLEHHINNRRIFDEEFSAIVESGSGERGIFNRYGSTNKVRNLPNRNPDYIFGANPCCEIILRPREFCNLSEVAVRPNDSIRSLEDKVRLAATLGAIQSTFTSFDEEILSPEWRKNGEEERLLGVSLTGIYDHRLFSDNDETARNVLAHLRNVARFTAEEMARKLGINVPAAVTTVKPSGTVSQLANTASGMHPRYASAYRRRVWTPKEDPISKVMAEEGVPYTEQGTHYVFEFTLRSPKGVKTVADVTAIDMLDMFSTLDKYWADHKPSCSVYVKEHEWDMVREYMWDNRDSISGVSFFPVDDHTYETPVYEEIPESEVVDLKPINWEKLQNYESMDMTENKTAVACSGGACEL